MIIRKASLHVKISKKRHTRHQSIISKCGMGGQHSEITSQENDSHLKKMTWLYTPGHAGVQGNERADFLANNAPTQTGRSMERADIINAVRSQLCDMGTSQTMERVRELGVKCGHARQCRLRGRERRYSNQLLMGTVSKWTLG